MAVLSKQEFKEKWGGKFADNTIQDIDEAMLRDFRQDIADTFAHVGAISAPTAPDYDSGAIYAKGALVLFGLPNKLFYQAKVPGLLPTPTPVEETAEWLPVAPPLSPLLPYREMPVLQAQDYSSNGLLEPSTLYRLTGRVDAAGAALDDVLVAAVSRHQVAGADAYAIHIDPQTRQEQLLAVSYELATDITSPRTGGAVALPVFVDENGNIIVGVNASHSIAGNFNTIIGGEDCHIDHPASSFNYISSSTGVQILAGRDNSVSSSRGGTIEGGRSNTIVGGGGVIPATCSGVTLINCADFIAPAGVNDATYINNVLVGGSSGAARVQLTTEPGRRVAVLAVESNQLAISSVRLFDNASAANFQLNKRVGGNWAPGTQLPLSSLNAAISALTPAELTAGAEIEIETQQTGEQANQFLALFSLAGRSGTLLLLGTRPARRVYNPDVSPQPQRGLLFNAPGSTQQRFSFPTPALTEATLTFWVRRNQAFDAGTEYWCVSGRPATNAYLTGDSSFNLLYYSDGVSFSTCALGMPTGLWKRVTVLLTNVVAGEITINGSSSASGISGLVNLEYHDVRLYSRHFSIDERNNRTAAPTDSLLARFTLPYDLDTSVPVLDESGHGATGTLSNF